MEMENKELLENEEQPEVQEDYMGDYQYSQKPLFEIKKGDNVFTVCAVIASVITVTLGVFGGFALGYLISAVLMGTLFVAYLPKAHTKGILSILCGVLALECTVIFILTSNESVRFFGALVGFLLALVCFDGLVNGDAKGNRETVGIFYSAFSSIDNIGVSLKSIFSNENGDKKFIGKVLIGVLCAVPVLIVVVPLLISSDDAFKGMLNNIFSNTFSGILKIILGVMASLFVVSYGFSLKSDRVMKIKEGNFAGFENVYMISFLSAISTAYLLYLFSQLAYFFSAFKGFLPNGKITYSEYARKGFFEMCVIAVINLGIVFLALLISKKQNGKVCNAIKVITTFIASFTLIIIATAISKMVLYINRYGMTVLRLTTSAFMVFLSVVFISVILRIYITKINIVKTALITAGCVILLLGTVNVNSVCAKYNYESYKANRLENIDINQLYELGDEGIPYIVKLTCSDEEQTAKQAGKYLAEAYLYDYFDDMRNAEYFTLEDLHKNQKNKGFERFSIPKYKAYESLYEFIEENSWFASVCKDYYESEDNMYF